MNARHLLGRARTRTVAAGTAALLAGGMAATVLLPAGAASASIGTCTGTSLPAGSSCTLTGTGTITGGTLTLATSPTALAWGTTLAGSDSQLTDTTAGHTAFSVNDSTGSGAGWNVTVSATTFTAGSKTLANSGTLALTGSTSSESATTAPDAACNTGSTCTAPTDSATYPLAVTTAASSPTAVKIYNAAAGTGLGYVNVGSVNPAAWWLNVPANAYAGAYTSTITWALNSAP